MIYEQRIYSCIPGRLPALLKRFETQTLPIWKKHGLRPVGFWTVLVGDGNHDLHYMLAWESLAEREKIWTAFQADPAWHYRARREREGRADPRQHQELVPAADRVLGDEVARGHGARPRPHRPCGARPRCRGRALPRARLSGRRAQPPSALGHAEPYRPASRHFHRTADGRRARADRAARRRASFRSARSTAISWRAARGFRCWCSKAAMRGRRAGVPRGRHRRFRACSTSSARASVRTARRSRWRSRSPSRAIPSAPESASSPASILSGEFLESGVPGSSQHRCRRRRRRAGRRQSGRPSRFPVRLCRRATKCWPPRAASAVKTPRGEIQVDGPGRVPAPFRRARRPTPRAARGLRRCALPCATSTRRQRRAARLGIAVARTHGPTGRRPASRDGRDPGVRAPSSAAPLR